jgi:dCMP deaminase
MFMEMAHVAARRSTCFRLNVGAIITRKNRPVSVGWNGAEAGAPHCAGNECPGIVPGNCGTLHAEANAIDGAMGIEACPEGWDLYCTDSPCPNCTGKIISCGTIKRVFFEKLYRINDHLDRLRERDIKVYMITPAGYIVEFFSRRVVETP